MWTNPQFGARMGGIVAAREARAAKGPRANKGSRAERDRRADTGSPAADPGASRVDRRVARSRAAILGAFEKLLGERPLAQITVSAIAREANIDRKTFYTHFGSVDGLLDAIAQSVVTQIADAVELAVGDAAIEGGERAREAVHVLFRAVNAAIRDNLLLNRRLVENLPADDLMSRVRGSLEREISARRLLGDALLDELYDYYVSFILSGIVGIYRAWALSDGSVPLERVSQVADDLTMRGLMSLEGPAPDVAPAPGRP